MRYTNLPALKLGGTSFQTTYKVEDGREVYIAEEIQHFSAMMFVHQPSHNF